MPSRIECPDCLQPIRPTTADVWAHIWAHHTPPPRTVRDWHKTHQLASHLVDSHRCRNVGGECEVVA